MRLSNRQLKSANRFTGAVYVLPWPEGLPVVREPIRDATPAERRHVIAAIGEQLAANGIEIVDIEVAWPSRWPAGEQEGPRLFVYAIHKRWLHTVDWTDAGDHAKWVWVA